MHLGRFSTSAASDDQTRLFWNATVNGHPGANALIRLGELRSAAKLSKHYLANPIERERGRNSVTVSSSPVTPAASLNLSDADSLKALNMPCVYDNLADGMTSPACLPEVSKVSDVVMILDYNDY